jgi:hypothetical protein
MIVGSRRYVQYHAVIGCCTHPVSGGAGSELGQVAKTHSELPYSTAPNHHLHPRNHDQDHLYMHT